MSWRAIKQEARDIVHQTMGHPCVYNDGVNLPVDCTVRHHLKTAFIGDDVEEFSPGLLSQINRVIVDLREIPNPVRNATLTFVDALGVPLAGVPVLKIDTTVPQGENYMMCEVKR
jgi:hypothetical protein